MKNKAISWLLLLVLNLIAAFSAYWYFEYKAQETALAMRRESFTVLAEALDRSNIGYWEWDFGDDTLTWSLGLFGVFGVPEQSRPTYANWLELIHLEDRAMTNRVHLKAAATGEGYIMSYRVKDGSGGLRGIVESAAVDHHRQVMAGVCREISLAQGF